MSSVPCSPRGFCGVRLGGWAETRPNGRCPSVRRLPARPSVRRLPGRLFHGVPQRQVSPGGDRGCHVYASCGDQASQVRRICRGCHVTPLEPMLCLYGVAGIVQRGEWARRCPISSSSSLALPALFPLSCPLWPTLPPLFPPPPLLLPSPSVSCLIPLPSRPGGPQGGGGLRFQ